MNESEKEYMENNSSSDTPPSQDGYLAIVRSTMENNNTPDTPSSHSTILGLLMNNFQNGTIFGIVLCAFLCIPVWLILISNYPEAEGIDIFIAMLKFFGVVIGITIVCWFIFNIDGDLKEYDKERKLATKTKEERDAITATEQLRKIQNDEIDKYEVTIPSEKRHSRLTFGIKKDSYAEIDKGYVILHILKDSTIFLTNQKVVQKVVKYICDPNEYNLVDIDWQENVEKKSKSVTGRAVAGAMLAGPVGAIVGGISGVGDKTIITPRIVFTLQDKKSHKVRMLSFSTTQKEFKDCKKIPTVALIDNTSNTNFRELSFHTSNLEKIKQLKELLDMDAISREEYDEKKKQLLEL